MKDVREYYFGPDGVINNETAQLFVDLFSDVMISFVDSTAKAHAKHSNGNVYYYRFKLILFYFIKINSNLFLSSYLKLKIFLPIFILE